MKEVLTVRSNPYFTQKEDEKNVLQLNSYLELIIIHTNGKEYKIGKNDFTTSPKLDETRLIVSPEMLTHLITDLQLHQKKLESFRQNADQLNSLINHISKPND